MNKDLKNNNNNDFYLPFIKTLYKGVEMESLPLASKNKILYRGNINRKQRNRWNRKTQTKEK